MYLSGGGVLLLNFYYFEGKSHESVSSPRGPPAGLLAEGFTAASRSREPEAAPYLEGLASSPCGSFNESPDSGTSEAPDDTSDSSLVVRWGWEAWASPGIPPKPPDRAEPLTPGKGAQVLCRLSQHIGLPMEGRGLCRAGPGGLKIWL